MTLHAFERIKREDRRAVKIVKYLDGGPTGSRRNASTIECDDSEEIVRRDDGAARSKGFEEAPGEFCEQSSVEDFGPLPESVFEAIEDSREGREVENNTHDGDSEAEADEDIKTTESTNRNLSPTVEVARCRPDGPENTDTRSAKSKTRKCPKCDKVYTASSSYFYHLKYSHNQNREHECDVCGKKFGNKAGLTAHVAVHGEERRYSCGECDKPFRSRAGLYIHEQTHGGVKAHGCSSCGRRFRWRTHLRRHEARHRPERPHACVACGRAFSVRGDLLRHARTHRAARLACDLCGRTFAQLRYLRVHAARKHGHTADPNETIVNL